jgi:RNA polymerase sigma-70 factor (ECF subfamily)
VTTNPSQLVDRCLAGDQEAMLELVEAYRDCVFRLCFRVLGHQQDAEDAAQETFVRALRSLSKWDRGRKFKPWLFAIAVNRCRTLMAAGRYRPLANGMVDDRLEDDAPDWQALQHLAEEVHVALQQIRPEFREAFVLFHESEISYEEVAEVMRRPLGTIKTWIRRARQELVRHLQSRDVIEVPRYEMRRV